MPVFHYSARRQEGVVTGVLQAVDLAAAAEQLVAQNLEPLTIEYAKEGGRWFRAWERLRAPRPPGVDALILFSRQMFALTRAGIPLVRAFQGLREHAHHSGLKEAMGKIMEDLQSGRDLSSALAAHPHVFGRIFPRLVHMGETTGRLDESFQQLFQYLEMDRDTRRRVGEALRYPLFVLLAVVMALFVVNYFVIPTFAGLFAKFGAELPLLTRVLVATSQFTQAYWHVIFLGGAGMVYLFSAFTRTRTGRHWWDKKKFALPFVGRILYRAALARLARTFAMGFRSGLTVAQTLNTVGETVDNAFIDRKITKMRQGVERGESLTHAAYHSNLFPPLVLQMLAVGEETGNIETMMSEVADFYDREVAYEIKSLSAAIEPILIFIVSLLVLALALGIFLPMWNLGSVALGRR